MAPNRPRAMSVIRSLSGVKRTQRGFRILSADDAVGGARSAASKCYRLVASKSEQFGQATTTAFEVLKEIGEDAALGEAGAVYKGRGLVQSAAVRDSQRNYLYT